MPTIEELQETKQRIENELKKPPHERDMRMFQHRSAAKRLEDIEEKIERKKERQQQRERKRKTRRKILLGAGFVTKLEDTGSTVEEYVDQHAPDWQKDLDKIDRGGTQRLIVLGGLIIRDHSPDQWKPLLELILEPEDSDWYLFPEYSDDS
jgi:hypothetical protein